MGHWPLLTTWGSGLVSMTPSAAACTGILAVLLAYIERCLSIEIDIAPLAESPREGWRDVALGIRLGVNKVSVRSVPKYLIRIVALIGLVGMILVLGWELLRLIGAGDRASWPVMMAPQTALALGFLYAAAVCATYQRLWALILIQVSSLVVLVMALSALVGHLFDTPGMVMLREDAWGSVHVGMPLPATFSLLALAAGFMAHASRDYFLAVPVRRFYAFRSIVLLLVSLIVVPLVLGWGLSDIAYFRHYGKDTALAALVVVNVLLQLPVILHVARRLYQKEARLHETVGRLRQAVREQDRLAAELRELSVRDAMTGLYNRRFFDAELLKLWRRGARTGLPLSLLFVDVDHFKAFNDHYGHPAGDRCLQRLAVLLREAAGRESDIAARYGGEEFLLLLPDTGGDGALMVAERLRARVEAEDMPHEVSAVRPVVTVSIGVATRVPVADNAPSVLTEDADMALYEAKRSGRNRVFVA